MDVSPLTRQLAFSSVFNFRDVGGYAGLDGRTVRWQRLYRSDSLHRLDENDQAAFAALGVRTVVDLRRPREIERFGRVPEYDGLTYRHIHPEHQDWDEVPYAERMGFAVWLAERYRDLATSGAQGIAAAIEVIAAEDSAPVVVHCAAGKDRTGVVCALTLSLLGVDDTTIAEDYALSEAASERFSQWYHARRPDARTVPAHYLAAPAEAMLRFLADLRERHGSVERYLLDVGLTPAAFTALRSHLLN
ncbi:MAG TPA: tyrosine-protein phosphatase [Micromonosporaceae bacterium]|nr:tyrosine-protein phosphatase [Micromonosporaceae bacterium]